MKNSSKNIKQSSKYILIFFLLTVFLFPVYWMITSSFKSNSTLMSLPPEFNIFSGSLQNYIRIISDSRYLIYLKNSFIVCLSTVLLSMIVSIFAGYALSRFNFRGKSFLMSTILSVQMFPIVAILISLYTFYAKLNLINTYRGLILADTTLALPFSIWFLKSFFDTIPRSLDEAATIDGCGRIRTLFLIITPLLKPGLLAVGIYTFLQSWDDFLIALTLISRDEMRTLPVGVALSFIGELVHDYAGMMTLSVVASIPVIIIFVFLQKYMIAGLTGGAVKG